MATNAPRPIIFENFEANALDTFEYVMVPAAKLAAGMMLVDPDLGTPVLGLDHCGRTNNRSGNRKFYAWDLEGRRGYHDAYFATNGPELPVAAR